MSRLRPPISLLRAFACAAAGLRDLFVEGRNARLQLVVAIFVVVVGTLLHINRTEWIIVTAAIGAVLSLEAMNTAVEKVVDLASPDVHPLARQAKDVAAAAVLIGVLAAVVIGCIIFFPKLTVAVGLNL